MSKALHFLKFDQMGFSLSCLDFINGLGLSEPQPRIESIGSAQSFWAETEMEA
jgi:hypothetical protein